MVAGFPAAAGQMAVVEAAVPASTAAVVGQMAVAVAVVSASTAAVAAAVAVAAGTVLTAQEEGSSLPAAPELLPAAPAASRDAAVAAPWPSSAALQPIVPRAAMQISS
jgi:hypothetical protein